MTTTKMALLSYLIIQTVLFSTVISYAENATKKETKYNTTILKYEKDLANNPQDPKVYYNLATAHYAIGDTNNATEEFQKAKELYIIQGNIEAALQLETIINSLTLPEALKKIEERIEKLEDKIEKINRFLKK